MYENYENQEIWKEMKNSNSVNGNFQSIFNEYLQYMHKLMSERKECKCLLCIAWLTTCDITIIQHFTHI